MGVEGAGQDILGTLHKGVCVIARGNRTTLRSTN